MMEGERAALAEMPAKVAALLGMRSTARAAGESSRRWQRRAELRPGACGGTCRRCRYCAEDLLGQKHLFPEGRLDQDLQQVDLRGRNSWRLLMAEVSSVELLEVQLINAVAPFILNARLKPLMLRTPERDKHIVNVSAVEGPVLPEPEDHAASAYEYGQGRAEHDDAHRGGGLSRTTAST